MAAHTRTRTRRAVRCTKHAFAPSARIRPRSDTAGDVTLPGQGHDRARAHSEHASGTSGAGNDPVNASDPSGLGVFSDIVDTFDPFSHNNYFYKSGLNGGTASQIVQNLDPAYMAINGYYNEAQAAENGCGFWTEAKYGAEGVLGVAGSLAIAGGGAGALEAGGYFTGNEFEIGDNFRISPFGNGNAEDPAARLPHYHWRQPDEFGNSPPGQGIGQHRPWQGGWFPW